MKSLATNNRRVILETAIQTTEYPEHTEEEEHGIGNLLTRRTSDFLGASVSPSVYSVVGKEVRGLDDTRA